ncbi:SDR family NAD(P)-dependent oxidoreductase [Pseudochryseolinea flava]|uniref:Short-chain dehydrogenase n=1 Tax=Pseudochryseolinea flava TaxID=2059302 RepID=A0A364YAR2_9BACT|nr:SDR family oxidoreductase [Pseudochryseolinea flava]RAW02938.1 short-chain dehydrogenase [Pseudochryseolinea flava]
MILKNKVAIVYGAGGSLGSAVSKAFAAEGAHVLLTGIRSKSLEKVASQIKQVGGKADVFELDALSEKAVRTFIGFAVEEYGHLDVSFNAIGLQDKQDIPLVHMSLEDFYRPIEIAMRTQFITGTAAARVMSKQGSGVILSVTATPGGIGYPKVGGFGPACCAIEGLVRNFASEVGPMGVRVINIRSAGSPDSRPFTEAIANMGEVALDFIHKLEDDTMLKTLPMIKDIANVAAFLASDKAGKITGVTIDVTSGTTSALNYTAAQIPF